jgi:hypothetical protein
MSALEKHYTVKEIGEMWHWGKDRVIRAFEGEPDVMRDGHDGLMAQGRRPRKRRYWTYSIPESAVIRVHNRFLKKHGVTAVMPRVEEA